MDPDIQIVKVGGSLFDLHDLKIRLRRWLDEHPAARTILVAGGGASVDVIRALDRTHQLGEESSHWLALRMLRVNGCFLNELLPQAHIVRWPDEDTPLGILDAEAFARADDVNRDHVPHLWDATSDSLAVRVAVVARAQRLILLKSVTWRNDDWQAAVRAGVVDPHFPKALAQAPGLSVRVANLRAGSGGRG